ncbi:fimbrial protein [Xenorhabdus koppenhoeferi]|uniref:Major type 1 subunit fimbrin (Pilin) n=1 Tax=Xenorhabdus koppenhoeferi TaxID=351659 RepID=A0A1I7I557_9GAMM|nr:fimbrial protein [Xenorhabdus koppenhoeferi]SFU68053.1 major type 1 subunit fimbrin (pilin) [Xenorhabdus koppenhoeferi]
MKTKLIISSVFVSSVFISAAHAIDGQIKFTGKITATACKIDSDSANQTVNMGTISSSSFNGAYSTSAPTRFSIKLTDCPTDYHHAQVKFDGKTDRVGNRFLALDNNKGNAAKGVALALYEDDSNTLINIAENSRPHPLDGKKINNLNFIAKYIATTNNTVTAGTGDAVAHFTIIYN